MTLSRLLSTASLALLAGCFTGPTEPTEPEVSRGVPVGLDAAQVALVQQGVRSVLKDPDSARFGTMAASQVPEGGIRTCGYVNARNSFGDYGREAPFVGLLWPGFFQVLAIGRTENEFEAVRIVCRDEFGITI